ncbi:hypothetical protein FQN49_008045 [Arthroderma sp. PD_2]|nr:hypothetical protein FQN49_008045 [Arthroderma sp. PD_2]
MASEPESNHNPNLQNASMAPHPNPPSIEAAYKRKCIALKKRLNEVEAHNDAMRLRNAQGIRYIQKMRLESCILLERLSVLMGMADGSGRGEAEMSGRAMALMNESGSLLDEEHSKDRGKRAGEDLDMLGDESDGSSGHHPPTPQERPLRTKRNRKSDERPATHGAGDNTVDSVSSTLPMSLPVNSYHAPPHAAAGYYYQPGPPLPLPPFSYSTPYPPYTSSSTVYYTHPPISSNSTVHDTYHSNVDYHHSMNQQSNDLSSFPPAASGRENAHRYVSAFEAFTNQNRSNISDALIRTYGQRVTDEDIDRALVKEWDALEPSKKREFGDRLEKDSGV